MKKMLNIKKIFVIVSIIALSFTAFSTINYVNAWAACMRVSPLSSKVVDEGGEIRFTVGYSNDINQITLSNNDLGLTGFTANIDIQRNGNERVVILSNIHNSNSNANNKSIYISEGTALSSNGALANPMRTAEFSIRATTPTPTPSTDDVAPVASISGPNPANVYVGGTVTYKVTYTDNVGIKAITLNANDIGLSGFTANKSVSISGNVATITLSNIQGNLGGNKFIKVTAGSAIDAQGNMCNAVTGGAFSIVQKNNNNNNNNNNGQNNNDKPQDTNNNNQNNGKPKDWVANPNTGK